MEDEQSVLAIGSSVKMPLGAQGSSRGATCHQVDSLALPTLRGVWIDVLMLHVSEARQMFGILYW